MFWAVICVGNGCGAGVRGGAVFGVGILFWVGVTPSIAQLGVG